MKEIRKMLSQTIGPYEKQKKNNPTELPHNSGKEFLKIWALWGNSEPR